MHFLQIFGVCKAAAHVEYLRKGAAPRGASAYGRMEYWVIVFEMVFEMVPRGRGPACAKVATR